MDERDDAITISGLNVAIPPGAIDALLGKGAGPVGVEIRLAGVNVRVPQAALDHILSAARGQRDDGGPDLRFGVTPGNLSVNLAQGGRSFAVSIPLNRLALSIEDGGINVTGE